MANKKQAAKDGRRAGLAAASWKFDGNTTDATYRAFLEGLEEGDPAVMDAYGPPSWLSGEWAGESMGELLNLTEKDDDRIDDLAQAYEDAADSAYWSELERVARFHTEGGK